MDKISFEDVYAVVRLIPKGRVTNYGAIAKYLSLKGGARLVGWAMGALPAGSDVPAHRVVNSTGVLTAKNQFGGTRMQNLLEAEGIEVKNDKIVGFRKVFWNPEEELM
ncbi:MGMT family protein [Siphonobacter aquaeclarae]|uniref:Methylated-DNA-protein-cysteine methyltransferase related protein n=1 Tax=Siphonobacter aquaeclarae TaxID=563176 RepID=A0A1G9KMV6_9BACT|nr:MGMT family protein [Siphonobacter aquaeclarae]SDL51098.1 methylated-DNA-protein-cysteine methyltransferase related protein [Siphonobacter aquaeclarae]